VLVGAAALLALVVVVAMALTGRGGAGAVPQPAPSPTATASAGTSPSTSASATLLAGFTDCSAAVGRPAQCGPRTPECWGQLLSVADALYVATPASCSKNHVYQTFAAGPLAAPVIRKSQLDADAGVRATCTMKLVNAMLPKAERQDHWEVYAIPAQSASENESYFRCVFGFRERSAPLQLQPPG
jgi:hypothetical protein